MKPFNMGTPCSNKVCHSIYQFLLLCNIVNLTTITNCRNLSQLFLVQSYGEVNCGMQVKSTSQKKPITQEKTHCFHQLHFEITYYKKF